MNNKIRIIRSKIYSNRKKGNNNLGFFRVNWRENIRQGFWRERGFLLLVYFTRFIIERGKGKPRIFRKRKKY